MTKKKITFAPGQPIGLGTSLLLDQEEVRRVTNKKSSEDFIKMILLCNKYEIEITEEFDLVWYKLALTLARELFPEPQKKGRKAKWTDLIKGALVVEVERHVRSDDQKYGAKWACTQLAKREPWKSFLEKKDDSNSTPDPVEALRKIYFDFREEKWANAMRQAFKWHQHQNTIGEWETLVTDSVKNIALN